MNNFNIGSQDILDVYKEEGKLKEYNYCVDYLKFMNLKTKDNIKDIAHQFCVGYNILLKWKNQQSTPYGIKCLEFLKKWGLLPYFPNERTAKIVGFLHGDGYLCKDLRSFGFVSSELNMLLKIKNDVEKEFKIKGKIKKKRNIGDIEIIYNKSFIVKRVTYNLCFNNKSICSLLFKLGVPRGKKIYQNYDIPSWVMKGNKNIQKTFLQGLFDSELSNARISTFKGHKDNLSSPRMDMCKTKNLENNLRKYLIQIKILLENFGVTSKITYPREYINKKISLTLSIHNKLSNIYNFIEKIGFNYSRERTNKSLKIKILALEKIKRKNILYNVLDYF